MSGARACDIRLNGTEVSLSIPLHKTDNKGRFTERSLTCSCSARIHSMCVWHSTERHLVRLEAHYRGALQHQLPLFPDAGGRTASKQTFIEAIRRVIEQTGTPLTRLGPDGEESHRFHGHVLRISGAQMLSSSGVELSLIQLLGRWTSTAVLRYTQDSALVRVPHIPQQVLSEDDPHTHRVQMQVVSMETPASHGAAPSKAPPPAARPKALAAAVRGLQAELEQVKQAVQKPAQTFVFRHRAKILHKSSPYEDNNEPAKWRTPCGWGYGSRTFLRTSELAEGSRRCRKCFNLEESSSSDSSGESSGLSDLVTSSASSAGE